jgi:hypothetical protein
MLNGKVSATKVNVLPVDLVMGVNAVRFHFRFCFPASPIASGLNIPLETFFPHFHAAPVVHYPKAMTFVDQGSWLCTRPRPANFERNVMK